MLITQYAKSLGIHKQTLNKRLSNYNIHDILAMLYVYDKIVVNKKWENTELMNSIPSWRMLERINMYMMNASSQYIIFLAKHMLIITPYFIIAIKEINYMFVGSAS